jgi:squalene-hopene/tetraprenyl-beta-curcumene cyclase
MTTTVLDGVSRPRRADVRAAVAGAAAALRSQQREDGSWNAPADMGPAVTAQVTVALHALGALRPDTAAGVARTLRRLQRDDGGWIRHPTATEGDLDATAHGWAALHVAGAEESRAAAARARLHVMDRGGTRAVVDGLARGDAGALSLAFAGLIPPRELPALPLAPLAIPAVEQLLLQRFHGGLLMNAYGLRAMRRWLVDEPAPGWLERRVLRRGRALFEAFQNDDGHYNACTQMTALGAVALRALGLAPDHDRIARAVAWIDAQRIDDGEGAWFPAFYLPVWCTCHDARALLATAAPGAPVEPAVVRAVEWMLAAQANRPQARMNNPRPGAVRVGGWPYAPGNDRMPDCDDTGVVLDFLGRALAAMRADPSTDVGLATRVSAAVERGCEWLLGMQNADGGWASYVTGLPGKPPGPILTEPARMPGADPREWLAFVRAPPLALGDPSTEDVTARVLQGLGSIGHTAQMPHVQRALGFLRRMQCDTGAFWGRWLPNFLSGTSFVLLGLASVKADLRAPWVERAIAWLLGRQRADGAWGETIASYRDPAQAGIGPASPPLTGLVVSALVAVGLRRSAAVRRGVAYLLAAQRADRLWDDADHVTPVVPPDTFYTYGEGAKYYPLEALAEVQRADASDA